MIVRIVRRSTLVLVAAFVAACGSGDGSGSWTTRDSSGILIAESFGPSWQPDEHWLVAEQPALDIGVLDGEPPYQLYRVGNAVRLDDGTIVVANTGTQEIRWFDAGGTHVRSAGGEGGGPGEFEGLYRVAATGDSIIAFDSRHFRASVFDSSGGFLGSATLEQPRGVMQHVFADGSLLVTESDIRSHLRRRMQEGLESIDDGSVRLTDVALRHDCRGAFLDSIGLFDGTEGVINIRTDRDVVAVAFSHRPFGRSAVFATKGDLLIVGTQDAYELRVFDATGSLTSLVRKEHTNRPVTAADVARMRDEYLETADTPEDRRARLEDFEELPIPEAMPAYGAIIGDSEGNLWVEEYRPFAEAAQWSVFDDDYRLMGTVELPPDLTVQQIGADFILATWQDELDVEHVRIYELTKP